MVKPVGLAAILEAHPFFAGLAPEYRDLMAGCARNVRFEAGRYVFRAGEPADAFYLVRHGRVALELPSGAGRPVTLGMLGPGEILGASWIVPPYRWNSDARVVELVRAIALDAVCLRRKCEESPALGWDLMKRFVPVVVARMQAARLQALDLYGSDG